MTETARLEQMNRSTVHELTPEQSLSDRARQSFVFHLKRELGQISGTHLREIAERKTHGAQPTRAQTEKALLSHPAFAAWSALNKGSQRRMWLALQDMIQRQDDKLRGAAQRVNQREKLGSLRLDSSLEIPGHLHQFAFHGQPGGYIASHDSEDLNAGLLQEAGGTLYSRGAGTGLKDSKAQAVVRYLNSHYPELSPRRILDLGCGYGGQTCGYALAYPEAQTHGVDVGEGLLRFAHLRAESLGISLHLAQADAAHTHYPDGHFDLLISNILLHEISTEMMWEVMKECHRLLAPGGIVIHQDVPTQKADMPGFARFMAMWQTRHNDEPFWEAFAQSSVPDALVAAGFSEATVFEDYVPQLDGPLTWYFVGARR